jgi:molybdopterin molybdotransferase
MEGFADRASLEEARQWIDCHSKSLDAEWVHVEASAGRVLAKTFAAPNDSPPVDIAVVDGYALRSDETIGAGSYNPLSFSVQEELRELGPLSAVLISSGDAMPQSADAVAPFELVGVGSGTVELIGAITRGAGVSLQGQEAREGTLLVPSSRPMRPSELGLISYFGITEVSVVRRPLVRLIVTGCKSSRDRESGDANSPMLRSLIARDGGVIETSTHDASEQSFIAESIARPGADVVLVCGLTGTGPDDVSPLALDEAGTLSIHGIALHPGESTGMGSAGDVPVILLPGSPLHCLCAYDLLACRLIRRLGGRCSQLPYRIRQATVGRKIVSSVGNVELCWVRLESGNAVPLGSAGSGGVASVARADGFVLVPAPLEGYAPGATVDVYLYDEADAQEDNCK